MYIHRLSDTNVTQLHYVDTRCSIISVFVYMYVYYYYAQSAY